MQDEIFHIPQAQEYCMGHVTSWDTKITTFPGVYVVSALAHGLVQGIVSGGSRIFDDSTLCSSLFLRGVTLVLGWACIYVIHGIVCHNGLQKNQLLQTILCAMFPLHAFFVHLYYTDTASTLFVLSTWLALLKKQYSLSGLLSACSILMRQTNAVWIVYFVGAELYHMATERYRGQSSDVVILVRFLIRDFRAYIGKIWIHTLSVVAFALFVLHNGGVVLGDKEHHVPVTHWAQPLYFYAFLVLTSVPLWLHTRYHAPSLWTGMGLLCLAFLAVRMGTLVHPFILADNRHYTFYIWRKVLGATIYSTYYMVPLYAMTAWLSIFSAPSRPTLQSMMLLACTAMVLIPAHLVEFRYFTIPWYIYMLDEHSVMYQTGSKGRIVLTIVGYLLVNTITMYVFLYKPFLWPDGSIARFMW